MERDLTKCITVDGRPDQAYAAINSEVPHCTHAGEPYRLVVAPMCPGLAALRGPAGMVSLSTHPDQRSRRGVCDWMLTRFRMGSPEKRPYFE